MKKYAVIHYHEIGLKGKNRSHFENILISNIKSKTKKINKPSYHSQP